MPRLPKWGMVASCTRPVEWHRLHHWVSRRLALDSISHPWDYYADTHNPEFRAGAARGHLSRACCGPSPLPAWDPIAAGANEYRTGQGCFRRVATRP